MVEVQLLSETEDQIFVEVSIPRREATFTTKIPKYSHMTTEQIVQRFNSICRMRYMRLMSVRSFESFINRNTAKTEKIKELRDAGEMENHLGVIEKVV